MNTILLIGKTGQVGTELAYTLRPLGKLVAPTRAELDLENPDSIRSVIHEIRPNVIVNAGGFTIVDDAESQADLALQLNAVAPEIIAKSALQVGALLVHFSTTFVFDGEKLKPYTEDDTPNPVNTYGRTKLAGERAVIASGVQHIILRANWVYSAWRTNFALAMLKSARERPALSVVTDQIGSPTWARDYANATAAMLKDTSRLRENPGIYHLSAQSYCSRMEWAQKLIARAKSVSGDGAGWAKLHPTTTAQYPLPASRPRYTVTNNRKIEETFGISMPLWEDRVDAFLRTLSWH